MRKRPLNRRLTVTTASRKASVVVVGVASTKVVEGVIHLEMPSTADGSVLASLPSKLLDELTGFRPPPYNPNQVRNPALV